MTDALIVTFYAAGGTLAGVLVTAMAGRKTANETEDGKFRADILSEVHVLRDEVKTVRNDLDSWKIKYFDLLQVVQAERIEREQALRDLDHLHQLERDHLDLKQRHEELLEKYMESLKELDRLMEAFE